MNEMAPKIFDEVLARLAQGEQRGFGKRVENEVVGARINHSSLQRPLYVPFRPADQLNGQMIMALIEKAQQSVKDLNLDMEMDISVTRVRPPTGTGKDTDRLNWQERYDRHSGKRNSSIIKIKNTDELCCARAIVVGRARHRMHDGEKEKNYYRGILRSGKKGAQAKEAKQLMEQAGLASHKGGCSLAELKKLQLVVPDYNLTVFRKESANRLFFKGPNEDKPPIYLVLPFKPL